MHKYFLSIVYVRTRAHILVFTFYIVHNEIADVPRLAKLLFRCMNCMNHPELS